MGTIAEGVKQALENCLRVRSGDEAVLITDEATRTIGEALRAGLAKATERVHVFVMEDFGSRPIPFPEPMKEALQAADVSIYAAQGAKGELATFRAPMLRTIDANPKLRHAHMIGITEPIMADGMCSDYQEIQRVSRLVYERVKDAREIRVVSDRGTDFTARLSPALHWTVSDGDIEPGHWKNLPDGEVFTSPATIEGTVMIDGCLGDFFAERYGSLEDCPIEVEVRDGRAVRDSLRCVDETLRREFDSYLFETDDNSSRVGEFAIGTNTGLTHLIYNLLQDEKFPGVHIAFGDPLSAKTGAQWHSKAHVDGVLKAPTITVDGDTLMERGVFLLS
jgi:leucyl aminopeptidase (aminopeptidase T)